ncbi:MAG: M48 family metallopeptidase [Pseudomonadota bacterium]
MDFFSAQDRSRRNTRWLVIVYCLATLAIVVAVTATVEVAIIAVSTSQIIVDTPSGWDGVTYQLGLRTAAIAGGVLAVIVLASLFRIAQLGRGGARVAQELGGTLVNSDSPDLERQRFRNVVEEMAIASGVPVPQIFVLEEESGINAFAAGFGTADAAIAVTRGALEHLNREELQGVVAHEFSHILNGDMRLNLRMMGVLFGIIVIGQIGRVLMRSGVGRRRMVSRRDNGGGQAMVLAAGLALFIIGSLGVVIARLIRASISRQREYLADASAVQFTRQTSGIAGALAKIGRLSAGSRLRETDAEEISHMLIAPGARAAWLNAMATHPPIEDRIRALDPSLLTHLGADRAGSQPAAGRAQAGAMGFAGAAPDGTMAVDIEASTERIGNPGDLEVALAALIRTSLPASIYDAAHSREWSFYLALAVALDDKLERRTLQLQVLTPRIGEARVDRIRHYAESIEELGLRFRLPILELCFPTLKERPSGQLKFLLELIDTVHGVPPERRLHDFALRRLLAHSLDASLAPALARSRRHTHFAQKKAVASAKALISIVAHEGHQDPTVATAAFERGIARLNLGTASDVAVHTLQDTDRVLATLEGLIGRDLRTLLAALLATVSHDGRITVDESELMRLIAAALGCPLPPIIDADLLKQHQRN